jgi:hypothetical protein
MAIDHRPAADARVAADLPAIHNPHVVEYLRVAVGQSLVADLCRAEDFCIIEGDAVFEDLPVLKNLRVAENLSPVADAPAVVNASAAINLRVV